MLCYFCVQLLANEAPCSTTKVQLSKLQPVLKAPNGRIYLGRYRNGHIKQKNKTKTNKQKKPKRVGKKKKTSSYPGVCDLELSQDVLGHVVLGHGVDNKVLVSGRTLCRPVLVTFFLLEQNDIKYCSFY